MAKAVSVVEATLRLDGSQWENAIKRAKDAAEGFVTDTRALMAGLGTALLGVSATLSAATVGLKVMGDQALELRKNLSGAFSGAELDKVADQIREISSLELQGMDTDELVEAAKRIGTFSDDVAGDLERVANVAARTGESFGSLKDYFAEFTVNAGAQDTLREIANITPEKLVAFGAVLDSTGERILTMGQYADSARKALRAVVDMEYSGSMQAMASNTDRLRSELQLLAQDAGTAVAVFADDAAGFLEPFVAGFRDFVGTYGSAIGVVTALGAALTGIGAAAIGVTLAAGALQSIGGVTGALFIAEQLVAKLGLVSLPAMASSAALVAANIVVIGGALAGAAILLAKWTKAIEDNTRAEEVLLAIEQQRAQWAKTAGDLQGKTTEELREQGATAADAARAILGLQDRIEAARKAGNEALAESLERQVKDLQRAKAELAEIEADQRAQEKAADPGGFNKPQKSLDDEKQRIEYLRAQGKITEREALDMQAAALDRFKADDKERRALLIETAKFETDERKKADEERKKSSEEAFRAELDRIKLLLTQRKISQEQAFRLEEQALEAFDRSEAEKRALVQKRAEQSAEDQRKAADKAEAARKGAIDRELARIELLRTEGKISADQEMNLLARVLSTHKLTEDERVKIIQKRASIAQVERDKEAAAEKKAADERLKQEKKNAEDLYKAQEEARQLQEDALDSKLESTKQRSGLTGKGNAAEVQRLLEEQRTVREAAILAERDKEVAATESAEARVQIEANAQEQIRQLNAETAAKLRDALGDQAGAVGDYVDALEKETQLTGKDNSSKLKQALQEQLNLEAQMIRAEGERAKAAATSAQERAEIEQRTQQLIRAEQLETAESYQQYLDEMAKADEEAKRKKRGESSFGGPFGIEDLNTNMQATLAQSVRDRGPSLASFAALPSAIQPRRPDEFIPGIAGGGVLAGVGEAVGQAVSKALAPVEQRVKVDVAVSDDRVRASATTVNGQGGDLDRAARGQRISRGPR